MEIHYTHLILRLNINNNSAVWPEQQNMPLRRWSMLKYPFLALLAVARPGHTPLIGPPGQISGGVIL